MQKIEGRLDLMIAFVLCVGIRISCIFSFSCCYQHGMLWKVLPQERSSAVESHPENPKAAVDHAECFIF